MMKASSVWLASTALMAVLFSPAGARAQYLVYDSSLYYTTSTYTLHGYSRTWDLSEDFGVAVEATLLGPSGSQLDYDTDTEYYWWQADVNLVYTLVSYGEFYNWYRCRGQHWYYDPYWGWQWLGQTEDTEYVSEAPSPYDETSYFAGWQVGQLLVAAFYADLHPPSSLYSGAWVSESVTATYDSCYAQWPIGILPTDPGGGYWQVANSSYSYDYVGSDYGSAQEYTYLIRQLLISPCGWSATQTLRFGPSPGMGTIYKSQSIGMFLNGATAAAQRGNGYAEYWMPEEAAVLPWQLALAGAVEGADVRLYL